jgi:hypothetical protein
MVGKGVERNWISVGWIELDDLEVGMNKRRKNINIPMSSTAIPIENTRISLIRFRCKALLSVLVCVGSNQAGRF